MVLCRPCVLRLSQRLRVAVAHLHGPYTGDHTLTLGSMYIYHQATWSRWVWSSKKWDSMVPRDAAEQHKVYHAQSGGC